MNRYHTISFNFGVPQYLKSNDDKEINKFLQTTRISNIYLVDEVLTTPKYARIKHLCQNEDNHCTSWALEGECEANPTYMHIHCPLACRTCDKLDIDIRCPLDHDKLNETNAWKKGDLERMYKRFVEDPYYAQYGPELISQPSNDTSNCSLYVATFENFMSDEECDRMIELAAEEGYEKSETVDEDSIEAGGNYKAVESEGRTSRNAWCSSEKCKTDPLMKGVMDRIANLTGKHY